MTDTPTTPTVLAHMLTRTEYAVEQGVHPDTVKGWLRDGKVIGAEKNKSGQWMIPAGAPLRIGNAAATVEPTHGTALSTDVAYAEVEYAVAPSEVFGTVYTLDEVAEEMNVTRGTVERLIGLGLLPGREFKGDRGATSLYLPPTSRD